MKNLIRSHILASIETKQKVVQGLLSEISDASELVVNAVQKGNKVLFFGNGGSAADAQHLAAELVGRYDKERRSLPAIALTTDSSILTCVANDYDFSVIFSRQIEALGKKGDVAIGISTSGNSDNVIKGIQKAKNLGLSTIALSGRTGGKLSGLSEVDIVIPSRVTAHIQECHIMIGHIICKAVEDSLFSVKHGIRDNAKL